VTPSTCRYTSTNTPASTRPASARPFRPRRAALPVVASVCMSGEATGRRAPVLRLGQVVLVAIAAVLVGTFSTWGTAGSVTLNGVEGPNDGWLVVILAACALAWTRMMLRGSWVGVVGVLGASLVIAWTAYEDWRDARDVLEASTGHGLLLVLAGSIVLGAAAVVAGSGLARSGRQT
jgi:hypothetical protein